MYEAANGLDWPDDARASESLVSHRYALPDAGQRFLKPNSDGTTAIEHAWPIFLAGGADLVASFAPTVAANPSLLADAANTHKDDLRAPERFAELASGTIQYLSWSSEPTSGRQVGPDEWNEAVAAAGKALGQVFLVAIAPQFANRVPSPDLLGVVEGDDDALVAFVRAGTEKDLIERAANHDDAARLLAVCIDVLSEPSVRGLLDRLEGCAVAQWTEALTTAGARFPELFCVHANRLTDLLTVEPAAARPNTALVAVKRPRFCAAPMRGCGSRLRAA
ncbi:hypothetical protein [Nostocoides australiense]